MEKRKIAVYCRVSTEDQAENGYNLREQERRIEQYLRAFDDEFPEEVIKYIDDGYSAKDLKRKEMLMLVQDIEDGLISKVIIHNLDRLTRSMKDLIFLIELFEKHEVQLFSLKEKIDTKTAVGRFFVSMIILIAQWERESISERTIRALDQSAYEGNWVHGRPPFGYDLIDKKLVVNDLESSIVKQTFHMYEYNQDNINKILHHHGSKYRNLGFVWSHDRIRNILRNEIYTGTYMNKRIVIDNQSPSIISNELFNAVQNSLDMRNRRDSHNYLFKSICFDHRTNNKLKHRSVVKANKTYLYYVNDNHERINQDVIDEELKTKLDAYIKEEIVTSAYRRVKTLKKRDSQLEEIDMFFDIGMINENYYLEQKMKLEENIKANENILISIISDLPNWSTMSYIQKRKFLVMNVKKIEIDINRKTVVNIEFIKKIKDNGCIKSDT